MPWSSAMSDGKRSKDSPIAAVSERFGSAVGGDDREHRSADERRAAGKALRNAVPRSKHGGWTAPKNRRDPLDVLDESNKGRLAQLIPIRFGRMAKSPFNFFRGSAAIMAADLASTPQSGVRVQACGDAHLLNFGCFATPERKIIFDINDFDETLPAPWEWDIKRLATSIVIAAQHLGLDDSEAARMATDTACSYRERMANYASMRALELWYDAIDVELFVKQIPTGPAREHFEVRMGEAQKKCAPEHLFAKLVEDHEGAPRIKDEPPLTFHPTPEQAPGLTSDLSKGIALYRKSLSEHVRTLFDRFHFRDLALKVVGVGSVGTMCAVALFMAADDDPIFLQIKEAKASVLEPYAGKSQYKNNGERVVKGQRLMQSASDIFLGWLGALSGRDCYIRQLRDTKLSAIVEDWDSKTLRAYGKICAWALAQAHARSGDAASIAGYMGPKSSFDDAICAFAVAYAAQNELDYKAFTNAIKAGRFKVVTEA
jgi:uncharacterized protein (DUF2252 family)